MSTPIREANSSTLRPERSNRSQDMPGSLGSLVCSPGDSRTQTGTSLSAWGGTSVGRPTAAPPRPGGRCSREESRLIAPRRCAARRRSPLWPSRIEAVGRKKLRQVCRRRADTGSQLASSMIATASDGTAADVVPRIAIGARTTGRRPGAWRGSDRPAGLNQLEEEVRNPQSLSSSSTVVNLSIPAELAVSSTPTASARSSPGRRSRSGCCGTVPDNPSSEVSPRRSGSAAGHRWAVARWWSRPECAGPRQPRSPTRRARPPADPATSSPGGPAAWPRTASRPAAAVRRPRVRRSLPFAVEQPRERHRVGDADGVGRQFLQPGGVADHTGAIRRGQQTRRCRRGRRPGR